MKTDAIDRCIKDFTDCSNSHARLIGLQAMRELKAIEAEIELRKKSVENLVSLSGDEFIRWNEDGSYTIKRAIPPASPDKAQQMASEVAQEKPREWTAEDRLCWLEDHPECFAPSSAVRLYAMRHALNEYIDGQRPTTPTDSGKAQEKGN